MFPGNESSKRAASLPQAASQTKTQPPFNRLIQLDVLRGIAILLVVACHFSLDNELRSKGALQTLEGTLARFGVSGVDLFFVLSGFLVGGLLFNEIRTRGTLDVQRFLVRRAFKIWPLYYVYVLFSIARWAKIKHSFSDSLHGWWPNLLHIQNYFPAVPRFHTWSLAVEEHFYLALPLVLGLALARRHRETGTDAESRMPHDSTPSASARASAPVAIPALPVLAFAVIAFCTVSRWIVIARMPTDAVAARQAYDWMYTATHLRIDSLFFGVLLAYWHHFEPQRLRFASRHAGALFAVGVLLVAPLLFQKLTTAGFIAAIGYNLRYLGYGAIMLALIYTAPSRQGGLLARFLDSSVARALAFIGLFSYPIYLWHQYMATYVVRALVRHGVLANLPAEPRWLILFALDVALAILSGMFWAKSLERPSLALRDRLFARLSPAPMEPANAAAQNAAHEPRTAAPA